MKNLILLITWNSDAGITHRKMQPHFVRIRRFQIDIHINLTGFCELHGIGKQIAQHIAAFSPLALSEADIDPTVLERELAVQTQKAMEENAASAKPKPDAVIQNNIIPGRMKKFVAESTLLGQPFAHNPDITVAQAASDAGVVVTGFVRMAVGEGIEKATEDFAAEVAKMVQG